MRILLIVYILLVTTLLAGFSDKPKAPDPPSFYKDVYPIIFSKCGGRECHGGDSRASVRYTSYRSIYAYRKKILKRINDERKPMPPEDHPDLTAKEKETLEQWIKLGSPEN